MSMPVTVRIAREAGSTISAKGLIIIAFLGILAYVLLAGGKGESASASERAGGREMERGEPTESENRSSRHSSASNTPVGSARTVSNPSSGTEELNDTNWSKYKKHPPITSRRLRANVTKNTAEKLFQGKKLPEDKVLRLIQIESFARVDTGEGPLISGERPSREDKPSPPDDPNREDWDEVWGSLPTLGVEAARLIANFFDREIVSTVGKLMLERTAKCTQDDKGTDFYRSWELFVKRAAIGEESTAVRLFIGWFADSYRCVGSQFRMIVKNDRVDMTGQLGVLADCLQYLETIGWWFWRQKLFGDNGVDLFGNCLRLNVPTSRSQKESQGPYEYKFELELTIFMWGGPVADGKALDDWGQRLFDAQLSLLAAMADLASCFYGWKTDTGSDSLYARRRVVFRPGFTTLGVNTFLQQSPRPKIDRQLARIETAERKGKVVVFPTDCWEGSGLSFDILESFGVIENRSLDRIFQSIITKILPSEAYFFNIRQHLWVKESLKTENSTMSDQQIQFALRIITLSVHPDDGRKTPEVHTITRLDLASFVPLVKTNSGHTFFPLAHFPALNEIIIPFLPIESGPGASAHIVLKSSYGIQHSLTPRESNDAFRHSQLRLTVVAPDAGSIKIFVQDILGVIHEQAAERVAGSVKLPPVSRDQINAVRREARLFWKTRLADTLRNLFVVNESNNKEASIYNPNMTHEQLVTLTDDQKWPPELLDMTEEEYASLTKKSTLV